MIRLKFLKKELSEQVEKIIVGEGTSKFGANLKCEVRVLQRRGFLAAHTQGRSVLCVVCICVLCVVAFVVLLILPDMH